MPNAIKHASFLGNLVVLGFGSIGHAVLPLLLRHIDIETDQIKVISADEDIAGISKDYSVDFIFHPLTKENYEVFFDAHVNENDFLLNLSVEVSSLSLIDYCWRRNVFYLDTCLEPWPGCYTDPTVAPTKRSNYKLREKLLALRSEKRDGRTAVVTQGANPGLASAFVKQALTNMAKDCGMENDKPQSSSDWAKLSHQLDIKVIHIAERDTQTSPERKKRDEFVNTWSVNGFVSEAMQPSELGWGTHEKHWPKDAMRHGYGCDASILLDRPGARTQVRSWTPLEGSYHGFLITHSESISITDHLTVREDGKVMYRPTVYYAYYPCDDAVLSLHELSGKNWQMQKNQRILSDEISTGMEELGVLLMGNEKGVYWFGSRLTIEQARQLAPHNTATSLQVAAGVLAGLVWALRNPRSGIVEPDDIDYETVMEIAAPYLGEIVGVYSEWTPLSGRSSLFKEEMDKGDLWQFINFRVQ